MTLRTILQSTGLALFGRAGIIAQTVTGSLTGTVIDPSGAAVPAAKIQLPNQGTAATMAATTDNSGHPSGHLQRECASSRVQDAGGKRYRFRVKREPRLGATVP